jgi:transposase InsO family protein
MNTNITTKGSKKMQVGGYLHVSNMFLQITGFEENGELIHTVELDSGDEAQLRRSDLIRSSDGYRYSSRLDELKLDVKNAIQPVMPPPENPDFAHLYRRAEKMIAICRRVDEQLGYREADVLEQGQTAVLRLILEEEGIATSTYYEYRKKLSKANYDINTLASLLRRQDFGQTRMTKAQEHFLDTMIFWHKQDSQSDIFKYAQAWLEHTEGYWVDPELCETVPENLVTELMNLNIPIISLLQNSEKSRLLTRMRCPSRSSFYNYYRWLTGLPNEGKDLLDSRYGEGTWEKQMKVFDTFLHIATHPLQYVFADHYLLKAFIVDDETRSKPIRLWLTVLIDVFTRCILGFTLREDSPSIESIQDPLRISIYPKDFIEQYGFKQDQWPCYGLPVNLFLDNAWAHHSHSLENLCRAIGQNGKYNEISLSFRTPYMARKGALVERFFGNLNKKIKDRLKGKGAIQSSSRKDVRNAAYEAYLLYDDIYKFILECFIEYQNTKHRGIGNMTPNEKWREALEGTPLLVPACTPAVERLFWHMYPSSRTLTQKGIGVFGLHYSSPRLAIQSKYLINGKAAAYTIRYSKDDISRIAVFKDDKYLCDAYASELRRPDGSYRQVSLTELDMTKTLLRSQNFEHTSNADLLKQLAEREETSNRRKKEQRAIQRGMKKKGNSFAEANQDEPIENRINHHKGLDEFGEYFASFGKRDGQF